MYNWMICQLDVTCWLLISNKFSWSQYSSITREPTRLIFSRHRGYVSWAWTLLPPRKQSTLFLSLSRMRGIPRSKGLFLWNWDLCSPVNRCMFIVHFSNFHFHRTLNSFVFTLNFKSFFSPRLSFYFKFIYNSSLAHRLRTVFTFSSLSLSSTNIHCKFIFKFK